MSSFINSRDEKAQYSTTETQTTSQGIHTVTTATAGFDEIQVPVTPRPVQPVPALTAWQQWYNALKQVWPIYLATHIAFLLLTYLANLFLLGNLSSNHYDLQMFLIAWNRQDTSQFIAIATHGYDAAWRTAFFPLFPMLEAGLSTLTRDPLVAGLIIANLATLGLFMALYRLVEEDFDREHAYRAVLYLALFPTAFFMAAAYNESLFLCLTIFSFYHMRRGQWWWAGLLGFLAALTRSAGLFLLVPFCYEYLRQHDFMGVVRFFARATHAGRPQGPHHPDTTTPCPYRNEGSSLPLQKGTMLRLDILSSLLIPAGMVVFSIYCAVRFHDPLAFSHAQSYWQRQLSIPGLSFVRSLIVIKWYGVLSFPAIHNAIDLSAGLFMLILTVLGFVGPWKFSKDLRAYAFYAAAIYLFLILFPGNSDEPMQSLSRLVLELFPAFVLLAVIGKRQQFSLYYLTISGSILVFMLLQFLAAYWIV